MFPNRHTRTCDELLRKIFSFLCLRAVNCFVNCLIKSASLILCSASIISRSAISPSLKALMEKTGVCWRLREKCAKGAWPEAAESSAGVCLSLLLLGVFDIFSIKTTSSSRLQRVHREPRCAGVYGNFSKHQLTLNLKYGESLTSFFIYLCFISTF